VKGFIFDIQRFSLHDGPGIRTTVFLKGCPLRCIWCHNPESMKMAPQLRYKKEKCTGCMSCIPTCSNSAHDVVKGIHTLDFSRCKFLGSCLEVCAFGALQQIGREMTLEEIMAEVIKDQLYYENSGGGITISGGEPMLQFPFVMELLKQAGDMGVHTCIETSGYADIEKYRGILPLVDLFLFDYKATGEEQHKALTGMGQELILSNLDFLAQNGARIILRCPLIPGINDQIEHLQAISLLSRKYERIEGVEILPYHDYAKGKWVEIGKENLLEGMPSASQKDKAQWTEKLLEMGCVKLA
jgi:pyruvate formate lyase activating enzyme